MEQHECKVERVWRGKAAKLIVTIDGGQVAEMGGKRAERATAVVVSDWFSHYPNHRWSLECRKDFANAVSHAALVTSTKQIRHHGMLLDRTPADWAAAIEVTEAAS
jgi:hypothetical protein